MLHRLQVVLAFDVDGFVAVAFGDLEQSALVQPLNAQGIHAAQVHVGVACFYKRFDTDPVLGFYQTGQAAVEGQETGLLVVVAVA